MKTDVVLLPGMHGSTALYDTFVSLAPSWANCLPVALPTDVPQSFSSLADAVASKLTGVDHIVLVGESFSGPVAAHLSRRLGAKVALLVLCNPLIYIGAPPLPTVGAWLAASRLVPSTAAAWLMTGGNGAVAQGMLREVRLLSRQVLAARIATALGATAQTYEQELSSGVLAVVGTRDRLLSPSRAIHLFSAVPYATVAEFPAPHLVVQTHPAQVWQAITIEFETAA